MISMEGNEMAKKLLINCASCDARKIQEENYSAYESITVNAATVLASAASKAVMNRLPFALNCANVIEVEGDVDLRTVNGKAEIKSDDAVPERKFYMLVNGVLNIGPDTQKQLAQITSGSIRNAMTDPQVGPQCLHRRDEFRGPEFLGLQYRQPQFECGQFHVAPVEFLPAAGGFVGRGDHAHDVIAPGDQRPERRHGEFGRAHEYDTGAARRFTG